MPLARKLFAEFLGTFCLVFAGTGAIVVNDVSGGALTHLGIALTFGLIVFVMIAALGHVSGAHLNPAVTVGLVLAKRFEMRLLPAYVLSQLIGAVSASLLLYCLFPKHLTLGFTAPSGAVSQSFVLEFILTLILMLVILTTTSEPKVSLAFVAGAVGATVGLEALFAGPICGASMNPARSFGPALVAWQMSSLWIYLLAPTIGAMIAVPVCRCLKVSPCCRTAEILPRS